MDAKVLTQKLSLPETSTTRRLMLQHAQAHKTFQQSEISQELQRREHLKEQMTLKRQRIL